MIAQDVMTEMPLTAESSSTLHDVMRTMLDEGIRHVPVVEGKDLVGVLSDRDLRGFSLSLLDEPSRAQERLRARVSSVMTGDVVVVSPETDLTDVIDTLIEHQIGAVPVVDPLEGDVVGIVSYVDVLRALRAVAESA